DRRSRRRGGLARSRRHRRGRRAGRNRWRGRRIFRRGPRRQLFVGGLAIDGLLVVPVRRCRLLADGVALGVGDRPAAGGRRQHPRALGDAGTALGVEERDQRLADRQLGDRLLGVDARILPQRLRRRLHHLLIARREGAQRVLHAIAELRQYRV